MLFRSKNDSGFDGERQEWQFESPDPDWLKNKITEMFSDKLSESNLSLSSEKRHELLENILLSNEDNIPRKFAKNLFKSTLGDDDFYNWLDGELQAINKVKPTTLKKQKVVEDRRQYLDRIYKRLVELDLYPKPQGN